MVKILKSGYWQVKDEPYLIEINPKDLYTIIYTLVGVNNKGRYIGAVEDQKSIVDCIFKAYQIIHEYNETNNRNL